MLNAKEVRKKCSHNATHPIMCSDELAHLVKPHQRYAYDLIVHVGLARYLYSKQREEIRAELYGSEPTGISCEGVCVKPGEMRLWFSSGLKSFRKSAE